ncbi:flagellar motor protein MotD [Kineobactrum sediminis]|uniref:Flagellar motor protein MotD n=1 Tax=Kineobactrum sediminis TaxID=1905677 RepID=A0A2N5Y6F1_9GAMM|nr:flagellar motor protein MotD [Kineobactrum sediminis]PLW83957.1 flagellar motor protein MotD [Kineobactrum sediminis]
MARKKRHEEHANHEAWAIPYGDLVTLLLAFFVVMYSISSVNEGKYRVLSDSMVAAFKGSPRSTQPIQIGDKRPAGSADQAQLGAIPPGTVSRSSFSLPPLPDAPADSGGGEARMEIMADDIRKALAELIELDQVRVRQTPLWVEVEINTDLLFPVGIAQVASAATPTLERLAEILQPLPNRVRIEGHTDDVPISTVRFPSNWELSAARASSVVRLFQERGVAPVRMAAIGLGEFSPVADNISTEGRNRNRRVTIIILASDRMPAEFVEDMAGDALTETAS